MKQTHNTISQISGLLALILAPLALAQAPDTFMRVEASALMLTPQIAMDRAVLFSDVLESPPDGTPRRFDGVSYLPMRLKEAGTVWVPEDRAGEFKTLVVGDVHLFEGTVDQFSRRFHVLVHGCRAGLATEEAPASSLDSAPTEDDSGSGVEEDRNLLLEVLLEDARKSLEELARVNNVTVAQLIESQPDGGQRIVENIVADSMQAQSPGANRTAQELMVGAVLTLLRSQSSMMGDMAADGAMDETSGEPVLAAAPGGEEVESEADSPAGDIPIADVGEKGPDALQDMAMAPPDALPEASNAEAPPAVVEADAEEQAALGNFWDAEPEYPPEVATGDEAASAEALMTATEESALGPAAEGMDTKPPAGEPAEAGSADEVAGESVSGSGNGSLSSFVAFGMEDFLGISVDAPRDEEVASESDTLAPDQMSAEPPPADLAQRGAEVSGVTEPGMGAEAAATEPEMAMAMAEGIPEANPAELAEPLPVPAEEPAVAQFAGEAEFPAEEVPPADLAELVAEVSGVTEPGTGAEAAAIEPEIAMATAEGIPEANPAELAESLPVPAEEPAAAQLAGEAEFPAEEVPPADLAELLAEVSGVTEPGMGAEAAATEPEIAMAMAEGIPEANPAELAEPLPVPAVEPAAEQPADKGATWAEESSAVELVPDVIGTESPVPGESPMAVDEATLQKEAEEQARLLAAEQEKAEKAARREELARQKEEKRRAIAEAKRLAAEEKKAAAAARKAEAARRKNEEAMAKAQAEALRSAQEQGSGELLAASLPEEVPPATEPAGAMMDDAGAEAMPLPTEEVPLPAGTEASIDAGSAAAMTEETSAAPEASESSPALSLEELVAQEAARLAEIARLKEEERQAKAEAKKLAAEEKKAQKEAEALRKAEEKKAAEAARALRREAEKQAKLRADEERKAAEMAREEAARRQAEEQRKALEAAATTPSAGLAAIEAQARLQREESERRLAELAARKAAAEAVIQAESQKLAESVGVPEAAAVSPTSEPAGAAVSQAEGLRAAQEMAENARRIAKENAERVAQEEAARVDAENRLRQMEAELRAMEAQVQRQEEEKAQIERRRLQEEAAAQVLAQAAEQEARLIAERNQKAEAIRLAQQKAEQARREAEETAARIAAEDATRKAAELRMQQLEQEIRSMETRTVPGEAKPVIPEDAAPERPAEPAELPEWMQPVWF